MKVGFRCYSSKTPVSVMPKVSKSVVLGSNSLGVRGDGTRGKNLSYALVFTGNPNKNMAQVASIAPEYQGILNEVYKVGGLGNVAGEAAVAFQDNAQMDFRTFIPYYSPDNETGGIKIKTPTTDGGFEFKSVPIDYKLKNNEEFVIHEMLSPKKPANKALYKVIEDTGIKGNIETIDENLEGLTRTPYSIFKVKDTGVNVKDKPTVYIVHTPQLAKFPRAYGAAGGAYAGRFGSGGFDDLSFSIFSKATVDAMPKLNDEQFGNFNPGNFWFHDRQAFPSILDISEKSANGDSYWRGIKGHSSYHNPGRDYQGHYRNPIDFFRINGTKADLQQLQKNPQDYDYVKKMTQKIEAVRKNASDGRFAPEEILSKEELQKLDEIFKPLYGNFMDGTGEYNLCMIPVESVRKNPFNFSAGTVSKNYGLEMKNHNTREIAPGLTKDFASIPTIDIVNGSSAKSLKLDEIGSFGKDNGFVQQINSGFTPLTKEVVSDVETFFNAKQSNKEWLINTIANAAKKGRESLESLIFSEKAIKDGSSVLGSFSSYKKGDILFIGWGRPDVQKGFPTTLEGILQFLKDDKVDASKKEHAKFLIGAGPWPDDSNDWKTIQKQMQEIASLDNGKYKDNVCYLNGFFTNRMVACADYSNITSRYEPCGITPLESFAAGTPPISNNTGGSPDFIHGLIEDKKVVGETGFLTKNAYLVNPEVIGADKNLANEALDNARRTALGKENADCIRRAVDLFVDRVQEYKQMMINAFNSRIDWFENSDFNGGKTAIEKYKESAWAIGKDNRELPGQTRNKDALTSLKGTIAQKVYSQTQQLKQEVITSINNEAAQEVNNYTKKQASNNFALLKNKQFAIFAAGAGVLIGSFAIAKFIKKIRKPAAQATLKEPIAQTRTSNSQQFQESLQLQKQIKAPIPSLKSFRNANKNQLSRQIS